MGVNWHVYLWFSRAYPVSDVHLLAGYPAIFKPLKHQDRISKSKWSPSYLLALWILCCWSWSQAPPVLLLQLQWRNLDIYSYRNSTTQIYLKLAARAELGHQPYEGTEHPSNNVWISSYGVRLQDLASWGPTDLPRCSALTPNVLLGSIMSLVQSRISSLPRLVSKLRLLAFNAWPFDWLTADVADVTPCVCSADYHLILPCFSLHPRHTLINHNSNK